MVRQARGLLRQKGGEQRPYQRGGVGLWEMWKEEGGFVCGVQIHSLVEL